MQITYLEALIIASQSHLHSQRQCQIQMFVHKICTSMYLVLDRWKWFDAFEHDTNEAKRFKKMENTIKWFQVQVLVENGKENSAKDWNESILNLFINYRYDLYIRIA